MIISRGASNQDAAFKIARAMDLFGFRIVSFVPDGCGFLVVGQMEMAPEDINVRFYGKVDHLTTKLHQNPGHLLSNSDREP